MEIHDAIELLRDAIGDDRGGRAWADFGAGSGTFTRALVGSLGAGSTIYAVDDDPSAILALRALPPTPGARVVPIRADFSRPFELTASDDAHLDGILFANSLHFVRDAKSVLTRLAARVRSGGRVVIVEYDRREASRWVPYPIPESRWFELAHASGLGDARITATRPSEYQGILYVGAATKP
jgi:SAM-dependent methyltransferase